LVTVKRYDDKFLEELAKSLEQTCWKASGNDDNTTAVVGVYEILPTKTACPRPTTIRGKN
jgi:hypothetical protein